MQSDFWSLDEVLSNDATVPTKFLTSCYRLGYLDQAGSEGADLELGATVDLPLWLARNLADFGFVEIDADAVRGYKPAHLSQLDAESSNVALADHPYYYSVGQALAKICNRRALQQHMQRAFAKRYLTLLRSGINMRGAEIGPFKRKLSLEEIALFDLCSYAQHELEQWLSGRVNRLQASSVATSALVYEQAASSSSSTTTAKRARYE